MGLLSKIRKALFGPSVDYNERLKNGAVLVDVRSKSEFKQGHAKQSTNIPLGSLESRMGSLVGKEVVLVCRSGVRASQAKTMLIKSGIEAHNAGAWQNVN